MESEVLSFSGGCAAKQKSLNFDSVLTAAVLYVYINETPHRSPENLSSKPLCLTSPPPHLPLRFSYFLPGNASQRVYSFLHHKDCGSEDWHGFVPTLPGVNAWRFLFASF